MDEQTYGPLKGVRVLDLADEKGLYCTKLLADLGADVIKIEPPDGDRSRKIGPFLKNDTHREQSLYWFHFNTNKRSITLNLKTCDGREVFKKLCSNTDIVVLCRGKPACKALDTTIAHNAPSNPRTELVKTGSCPTGHSILGIRIPISLLSPIWIVRDEWISPSSGDSIHVSCSDGVGASKIMPAKTSD